jgi:multiple antibiotic resistance protein
MTSTETVKFIVAMTIMMNPLGSLSIFLDLTRKSVITEQRKIAISTSIAVFIMMIVTVWTGKDLLNILGITIPSFRVAGGLILLLMGLSMLQSKESPLSHTSEDDIAARERQSVAVVPMALPVIIGPGAISTIIIAVGDSPQFFSKLWLTILCFMLTILMAIVLYFAVPIARIVGVSVIKVITRIMGMLIMAIAVGMLANGLVELFPAFS